MEAINFLQTENRLLIEQREKAFNELPGPRVGDFCEMLDGSLRRFTYDWYTSMQVTAHPDSGYSESFYLSSNGADYSGALDPSISKEKLENTGRTMAGTFWIFNGGVPGAGRGKTFEIICKVWKQNA